MKDESFAPKIRSTGRRGIGREELNNTVRVGNWMEIGDKGNRYLNVAATRMPPVINNRTSCRLQRGGGGLISADYFGNDYCRGTLRAYVILKFP